MDLSSWETINAASGAGASFMAKAASHFQQVAGNISGAGIVTNSAESSNIKNSIKPFAKADDSNEEAWIMGRKYYTQSGTRILFYKHQSISTNFQTRQILKKVKHLTRCNPKN